MTAGDRTLGFTVLELMVALAVGGLVLTILGSAFSTVALASNALVLDGEARDLAASQSRRLTALFGSVTPSSDSLSFVADSATMTFYAMVRQPDSSFARRRVQVTLETESAPRGALSIKVLPAGWGGALDFLAAPGLPLRWRSHWRSANAPMAVRLRAWPKGRSGPKTTTLWLVHGR